MQTRDEKEEVGRDRRGRRRRCGRGWNGGAPMRAGLKGTIGYLEGSDGKEDDGGPPARRSGAGRQWRRRRER